jgi:hypothetical protein
MNLLVDVLLVFISQLPNAEGSPKRMPMCVENYCKFEERRLGVFMKLSGNSSSIFHYYKCCDVVGF